MQKNRIQIKTIISEVMQFAATAQEEAEKINSQVGPDQLGMTLVTDQAFWEKQGIKTGEELALSVLGQTYSDLYKDIHGFRPRHSAYKTVDQYTHAIRDLDEYYQEIVLQGELDLQRQKEYEKEREELEALMPGEFDFQELPKQSGMGRRMENRIRLTVSDLEHIINEAMDGHPYDGPIESTAAIHAHKWGHGEVVDPKGWDAACKLGGKFTKGKAPSILSPKKFKMTERRLRSIVKMVLEQAGPPAGGYEYGEFAKTPEVQQMLMDAGFNADGSFGADGYPGPTNWQMYSPKDADEAAGWIQAALDMNDALRDAEAALASGEFEYAQDAYHKIIEPVQSKYSQHGAADTEGREVAGDWLEHKKGFKWSGSGW